MHTLAQGIDALSAFARLCFVAKARMYRQVQMWSGVSPSPGADVGEGEPKSRCRWAQGRAPVPAQMWAGEPSPGADVGE